MEARIGGVPRSHTGVGVEEVTELGIDKVTYKYVQSATMGDLNYDSNSMCRVQLQYMTLNLFNWCDRSVYMKQKWNRKICLRG